MSLKMSFKRASISSPSSVSASVAVRGSCGQRRADIVGGRDRNTEKVKWRIGMIVQAEYHGASSLFSCANASAISRSCSQRARIFESAAFSVDACA